MTDAVLRINGWEKWQGAAVRRLSGKRVAGTKRSLTMAYISVATDLRDAPCASSPGSFERFARAVGGRNAETYWLRILQYVGIHDPEGGGLRGVDRGRVGDLVLGRAWDRVSGPVGARVWDSLISSGLASFSGLPTGVRTGAPAGARPGDPGLGLGSESTSKSTPPIPPLGHGATSGAEAEHEGLAPRSGGYLSPALNQTLTMSGVGPAHLRQRPGKWWEWEKAIAGLFKAGTPVDRLVAALQSPDGQAMMPHQFLDTFRPNNGYGRGNQAPDPALVEKYRAIGGA